MRLSARGGLVKCGHLRTGGTIGVKNGSFFRTSFVDDPKSNINVKYADDAYLLIGSKNINTAAEEFSNITTWAVKNNLRLNHTKTKEMIIWKIGTTKLVPAIIPGAIRVESPCMLGVTISSDLKMDQHKN